MAEQPTRPHEAPDFATFVTDLDDGRINQILTEKLAEVVRAVQETGKVGEVAIKVLVKKEGLMAVIGIDVKSKVPEHALHGTLFYVGANGELLRDDPRQQKLKGLGDAPTKLRTVAFPVAAVEPPTTSEEG